MSEVLSSMDREWQAIQDRDHIQNWLSTLRCTDNHPQARRFQSNRVKRLAACGAVRQFWPMPWRMMQSWHLAFWNTSAPDASMFVAAGHWMPCAAFTTVYESNENGH